MESSGHSRNSSSDAGEQDIKYRDCDDMLSRRVGGNIPAPLRKKKDESYKRFITPSGNPMVYVKQHMRSKSLSDIQVENAARDQERDERNTRYEEMEKLKEMLKEEEETWTSNLDNWKQRRRSATLDARRRKEVRDSVEQSSATTQRKAKTYREMLEDKKRRESGSGNINDDDSNDIWNSLPSEPNNYDASASSSQITNKKYPYRGAISVPNFAKVRSSRDQARTPSPPPVKPSVERVTYTSRVTAVIDHYPSKSNESSDLEKKESVQVIETKNTSRDRVVTRIGKSWPPPSTTEVNSRPHEPVSKTHVSVNRTQVPDNQSYALGNRAHVPESHVSNNRTYVPVNRASVPVSTVTVSATNSRPSYNSNPVYKRSQSPPVPQFSKNSVQMRNRNNSSRQSKERPKSAYGSIGGDRAASLPRNYHSYSAPKVPDPNTSDFIQNRKSAFASKRSMWENMAHQKQSSAPAAPQHLASLLKNDTERLYGNDHSELSDSKNADPNPYRRASSSYESSEVASPRENGFPAEEQTEYKPKIMSNTGKTHDTANLRPWQRAETETAKPDAKSIHKHVNAPVARASWGKSATLPSRARISMHDDVSDTTKPYKQDVSPRENGIDQESPRSNASNSSMQFHEMKICINQRPKSEKGFGFTVRGGDDGKPVIVNTVSPGGAADICQLWVGDEILAINDVRLTSSLTQDGIVKLIVDSVMTGNLSLDIKRCGKSNKPSPLRLSGTKVVMTSGGFVQVRSDKGKTSVMSPKSFNGNSAHTTEQEKLPVQQEPSPHDLPLPPPPENLEPPKRLSAMDRLSPKKPSPNSYRRASPLSNLINAAKSTSPRTQDNRLDKGKENDRLKSPSINTSSQDYDEQLENDVLRAQHELAVEESYLQHERRQHEENMNLRKQLLEEQRMLEEREAKREEEKRRRIEEAKAEEQRLEEELRKIEAAKLEQQKRREEEKRKLMESQSRFDPTFNHGELNHWLIEEAERSRVAEDEGRRRVNVFDYDNTNNGSLSNHMMPHFSHLDTSQQNTQAPQIPGSLANYWNDPNTRATLL